MQAAAAVMVAVVLLMQHIEPYISEFVCLQELDIAQGNPRPEPQRGLLPVSYP